MTGSLYEGNFPDSIQKSLLQRRIELTPRTKLERVQFSKGEEITTTPSGLRLKAEKPAEGHSMAEHSAFHSL
jgi:hypothetical protein